MLWKNTEDTGLVRGMLCSFAAFSLFAIGDALFKYLMQSFPLLMVSAYSSFFALTVLLAVAACSGGIRKHLRTAHPGLHLLRAAGLLFQFLTILYAFRAMPLASAYAIVFAAPFLAAVLAIPVLKEYPSGQAWMAIAAGFCGVFIVLRPTLAAEPLPACSALLTACLFALCNVLARLMRHNGGTPLTFALYPELVTVAGTAVLAAPVLQVPTAGFLGWSVILGGLCAGGMVLMARAFVLAPAALAAPFHYTQILWGVGLGWLMFGDSPDAWTLAGASVIAASGILLLRARDGGSAPE